MDVIRFQGTPQIAIVNRVLQSERMQHNERRLVVRVIRTVPEMESRANELKRGALDQIPRRRHHIHGLKEPLDKLWHTCLAPEIAGP